MMIALVWIRSYGNQIKEITPSSILLYALMSVAFTLFFLPQMHERYFYLADIISLLVAFYFPWGWLLTADCQLILGLSYSIFLLMGILHFRPIVASNLLISALLVNIALIGFLFSYPWKLTSNHLTSDLFT